MGLTTVRSTAIPLAIAIVIAVCSKASASLPPPQPFLSAESGAAKSKTVEIIAADDSVERGQESHPPGAVFSTERFCHVVLDVVAGPGLNAFLNVMGNRADEYYGEDWFPEVRPIDISNHTPRTVRRTFVVPLRHSITEFFLGAPATPAKADLETSIAGAVHVFATAISCQSDTSAW